jgi:hypothetical protein
MHVRKKITFPRQLEQEPFEGRPDAQEAFSTGLFARELAARSRPEGTTRALKGELLGCARLQGNGNYFSGVEDMAYGASFAVDRGGG